MRAKKIATQVKAAGRATLLDVVDNDGVIRQWISNGYAAYPIDGMPYLKIENLPSLLSLSEKEQEKILFEAEGNTGRIDLRDCAEGEAYAQDQGLLLYVGGKEVVPLLARERTYFVDAALLTPIAAEYKHAELWLRETADGAKYFAVKNGLLLVGIVMPMMVQQAVASALTVLGESYCGDERGEEQTDDGGESVDREDDGQEVIT